VHRFVYDRGRPFVRGARRGVDLRVAGGAGVRAPCTGVVAYAGRVFARGLGITIRCGLLRATVLGLRLALVRRGASVRAGDRVGLAAGPILRLGARLARDRFGYIDPLTLLGGGTPPPRGVPLGRAPRPTPPGGALLRRAPRPVPALHPAPPARSPRAAPPAVAPPAAASRSPAVPLGAYIAVALLAVATGIGGLARRRRSRSARRPAPAALH
jgi:hypothetical protein